MKRIAVLLLILSLLLCGCGPAADPDNTPGDSSDNSSVNSSEDSSSGGEEQPEDPVVLYRHPLTGEALEAPFTGGATAVVVNNIKAALPQYGISAADIFYEIETEGGITRCLAIYSSLQGVGSIGPVRSARTYFSNVAVSYDAPLIHCGGSVAALNGDYDDLGSKISNWKHINEQYNGQYFFRDYDRYNAGVAWEHTLFTNGEKLLTALNKKGYDTQNVNGTDYGLLFDEDGTPDGETANTVTVKFKGNKSTTLTYDAADGIYKASQYSQAWKDAGSGEQMAFENVLVLYADQWKKHDGTYSRSYYDLIGSGTGLYACGGKVVPIQWTREALNGAFAYTLADGTPLVLGVGKTYIAITDDSAVASYE